MKVPFWGPCRVGCETVGTMSKRSRISTFTWTGLWDSKSKCDASLRGQGKRSKKHVSCSTSEFFRGQTSLLWGQSRGRRWRIYEIRNLDDFPDLCCTTSDIAPYHTNRGATQRRWLVFQPLGIVDAKGGIHWWWKFLMKFRQWLTFVFRKRRFRQVRREVEICDYSRPPFCSILHWGPHKKLVALRVVITMYLRALSMLEILAEGTHIGLELWGLLCGVKESCNNLAATSQKMAVIPGRMWSTYPFIGAFLFLPNPTRIGLKWRSDYISGVDFY